MRILWRGTVRRPAGRGPCLGAVLVLAALAAPAAAAPGGRCTSGEVPDIEREDSFHAGERMEVEEGTPNLDANAYRCYEATGKRPAPFPVRVADVWGAGKVMVLKPYLFCAPTSRNGEPVADLDTHLVCYQIRSGVSRGWKRRQVQVLNHFGSSRLSLGGANLLCLPSGGHSVAD